MFRKIIWAFTVLISCWFLLPINSYADEMDVEFSILPALTDTGVDDVNEQIYKIWYEWWHVWENYNDVASKIEIQEQLNSWIMNWNTILDYLAYIVKFLSQLWLVVWVVFIMFAWYKYMTSVFTWWKPSSNMVKNAIIWVIIVIFSYTIMKILTSIIWLS